MFILNSGNGKFSRLAISGEIPPKRERHSAILLAKKLYIFGGFEREGDRYFNDMWMFDTGNPLPIPVLGNVRKVGVRTGAVKIRG
jgi:hypothetical protein